MLNIPHLFLAEKKKREIAAIIKQCRNSQKRFYVKRLSFVFGSFLGFIIGYDTVRCSIVRFMSVHWHGKPFFVLAKMELIISKIIIIFFCMFVCRSFKNTNISFPMNSKPTNSICISTSQIPGFWTGLFSFVLLSSTPTLWQNIYKYNACSLAKNSLFTWHYPHSLWIGSDASLGAIQLWLWEKRMLRS